MLISALIYVPKSIMLMSTTTITVFWYINQHAHEKSCMSSQRVSLIFSFLFFLAAHAFRTTSQIYVIGQVPFGC
jgi:hypothetical protein